MKKSENKGYLYICLFYLILYISIGVFSPYLNVYYERLGFEGSQIGLVNSLSLIAAMLITPIWGNIGDKTRNTKGMIAFLMLGTAVSAFIWHQQTAFFPTLILAIILAMFRNNIWSFADGISVEYCEENKKDFGFARSMGSLGYLLGSSLIANLMFSLGFSGPYIGVMIVGCVLGAILVFMIPGKKKEISENKKKTGNLFLNLKSLFSNKNYVFLLMFALLTNVSVDCAVGYSGNHLINTLGQKDSMIGIFSFIQVFPEILLVMFASRIFRRFKPKQIFMISVVGQIIRFFLSAMTSNIWIFLAATSLHGFTIAVGSVALTAHINKNVDRSMLTTAMAVYSSMNTIGAACINQLFGFVYQYSSSYGIFWFVCFTALAAGVLVLTNKNLETN